MDDNECRVILVPEFKTSGSIVLVNIATLECLPITIKSEF